MAAHRRSPRARRTPTAQLTDEQVARLTAERFAIRGRVRASEDVRRPAAARLPLADLCCRALALLRFRHQFVPWMHRRFGDVFTVRLLPGGQPLVLFARPEHAREIFAGDPEIFHAGKGNAILGPIMGEHSLLLQDGAEHKRARQLLMPAFNGAALSGYETLVAELARAEVATLAAGPRSSGPWTG